MPVWPPTLLSLLSWCSSRIRVRLATLPLTSTIDVPLDIERMYGKRQPIAVRKPLASTRKQDVATLATSRQAPTDVLSTPSATEAETASETDIETEVETPIPTRKPSKNHHTPRMRNESLKRTAVQQQPVSMHDLHHKYFRRDAVGLHNIDLLRYGAHRGTCPKNSLNRIPYALGLLMRCWCC